MRLIGRVEKGWGHELIFASTDQYCGKFLEFNTGAEFSMHFHAHKDETWYVLRGNFLIRWIDTVDAMEYTKELSPGDTWHNPPLVPHQLHCLESGCIVEVSTPDSIEDNYRVRAGDSQQ